MPRAPQQARSRKTLERIVNAALSIVAERGAEEATVQDIVKRARSSVGSFYSRFEGKDELLAYLEEQVWDDALSDWTDVLKSQDAPGDLRGAVSQVVRALMKDREGNRLRRRAFGVSTSGNASDAVRRFSAGVLALVRGRIQPFEPEIGHPEPSVAVDLGFLAAAGALEQLESDTAPRIEDEAVATELERIYGGYLAGAADYGGASDPQFADPFDVWT